MNTPWGNSRATYFSRGIPLPPRGSTGDFVMQELLDRERRERLSGWELALISVGKMLGMDTQSVKGTLTQLVEAYRDEVTQRIYDMSYIQAKLMSRLIELRTARRAKDDVMDKLSAMGS